MVLRHLLIVAVTSQNYCPEETPEHPSIIALMEEQHGGPSHSRDRRGGARGPGHVKERSLRREKEKTRESTAGRGQAATAEAAPPFTSSAREVMGLLLPRNLEDVLLQGSLRCRCLP